MTDKNTITLPREVVEKAVKAFENGCPPTCENGMVDSGGFHPWGQPALVPCPACLAFEHLRTHLAAPRLEVTVDPRLTAEEAAAISAAIDARKKEQSDDLLREFRNGAFVQNALAAEPTKQEPVAWMVQNADGAVSLFSNQDEAYEYAQWAHGPRPVHPLYISIAAEQPKQEPVAWMDRFGSVVLGKGPYETFTTPLYTAPPATHPGYVIGSHWLETAYSRICAGEAEADVLRDCGWERVDDAEALRRDAERYRWGVENARWVRHEHEAYVAIPVAVDADLSCTPMMTAAIDAAMKEGT